MSHHSSSHSSAQLLPLSSSGAVPATFTRREARELVQAQNQEVARGITEATVRRGICGNHLTTQNNTNPNNLPQTLDTTKQKSPPEKHHSDEGSDMRVMVGAEGLEPPTPSV